MRMRRRRGGWAHWGGMRWWAVAVAVGRVRCGGRRVSPLVGWQPESAMRQIPRGLAGNETALLYMSSGGTEYGRCAEWWPKAYVMFKQTLAEALYATSMFVRCGHGASEAGELVAPASKPDAATAETARRFFQGPMGARAYVVVEWTGAEVNGTRLAMDAMAQGWTGAALLTSNGSASSPVVETGADLLGGTDPLVVVDVSPEGTVDQGDGVPTYAPGGDEAVLVTDLWRDKKALRASVSDQKLYFDALKAKGTSRVCLIVDFSTMVIEDFQQLSFFGAYFAGVNNYPWLSLSPPENKNASYPQRGEHLVYAAEVDSWRSSLRETLKLNTSKSYSKPVTWAAAPQVMIHDRYLSNRGAWTVDSFLDDLVSRYGGVDAVLLWTPYPNIGVDDRSQFDLTRDVVDLQQAVDAFNRRGVDVLLPYLAWDSLSKKRNGTSGGVDAMLDLADAVGARGINGDTVYGMRGSEWRRPDLALMPECGADLRDREDAFYEREQRPYFADAGLDGALQFDAVTWNYYALLDPQVHYTGVAVRDDDTWGDPKTGLLNLSAPWDVVVPGALYAPPLASRAKLLDARHNALQCDRWATDHTNLYHHAFFSGSGLVTWENVWGVWNGLSDRDASAVRRISHLFRHVNGLLFGAETSYRPYQAGPFFSSNNPLPAGVFAASFSSSSDALALVVNRRGDREVAADAADPATRLPGDALGITCPPRARSCCDAWNGRRLLLGRHNVSLEPLGYAAIFVSYDRDDHPACDAFFLAERRQLTAVPLSDLDTAPKLLTQHRVVSSSTQVPLIKKDRNNSPSTLVNATLIQGGAYRFTCHGVQLEGTDGLQGASGPNQSPDVQFEWEDRPTRFHDHNLTLESFYVDVYPVTNRLYSAFVRDTGYQPLDHHNFLRHLHDDKSHLDDDLLEQPVRWVSLTDARAYCAARGGRLPRSFEWSRVAQGPHYAVYPWGPEWNPDAVPDLHNGTTMPPPPDVGTHPLGASAEGVHDLVATIWQWSDEFCDDHTCRAVIRGGSPYRPSASPWYLPYAYRNDEQQTYLLFSEPLDRSAGIGFRCVYDYHGPRRRE